MEAKGVERMHSTTAPPGFTQKKAIDISYLQIQPYYKIHALLKDVRPHFLQVLRTPDFRNCEAAGEIRQKLKLMLDIYKEPTEQTINVKKCKTASNLQKDKVSGDVLGKPQTVDVRVEDTYIVGGPAFGWNFITFPVITITSYGRTNDSFRALNP